MSARARVGVVAVLVAGIAAAAAYLNNWLAGVGLPLGGPTEVSAPKDVDRADAPAARGRVVVQGERCMLAGDAAPRACDAACADVKGKEVDIDATVGAQKTVDDLRACLQQRGVKVRVDSE